MEYEITSRKNPAVMHLRKLGNDREYRYACGEFVGCGEKLLREALLHGAEIRSVFREKHVSEGLTPAGAQEYVLPEDVLTSASPFRTAAGVLFICKMKDTVPLPREGGYVILEDVQDPGNVGTVLRTANAFGRRTVALLGDCADPYNPKAVRASMGAVFRQSITRITMEDIRELTVPLYGAALGEGCRDIREMDLCGAAVAIGSEGHGLSRELLELCTGRIIIPMIPECESLNAAAAATVVLWEMSRKTL